MSNRFFEKPILNSPYDYPGQHWELDASGQPTGKLKDERRESRLITPIPRSKKQRKAEAEPELFDTERQKYDPIPIINEIRGHVDTWRRLPETSDWGVTPDTRRLLNYWRHHQFEEIRPFFCQVEAVETLIWLTEVAPKNKNWKEKFLGHLENANRDANPELDRLALKLATGAGKTTVMAMIIAWQTVNSVRHPNSKMFTRGFLIVTPGITIKDRLRVLMPNDPDSYYTTRELIPHEMLETVQRAKIVVTNYHSFKHRERMQLSKGTRSLLKGRGEDIETLETEGQMIQRVMPELMGLKNIMVINDEAHHCYREKPESKEEEKISADEKQEVKENKEAARLWINGLEAVKRKLGVKRVVDLSATPFFLRGSGYAEGTLFPWTMSDFSLMDAIECGIVKLPRVPVSDNYIKRSDMPMFRNLWEHIGKKMPKKKRGQKHLDPLSLPVQLQTALDALYGHYEETFEAWQKAGIDTPPCFIVVCNNTATSKLVYDFISGFDRENDDGSFTPVPGRLPLFRNTDDNGNPLGRPNTLLIDSAQLESGEALDKNFREIASTEIERFRREILERTGDKKQADSITDQDLLREVMNTVGKKGKLGESIRCVVSVSMLTEGWDANNVTHVLGVRAFGTQLLCEQVIGRALRRQSYELNENDRFNVEYADVLGIPFDFTTEPVVAKPQTPRETINVKAVKPERDALEITFPRVEGYRIELPQERLKAEFNEDSVLILTPDLVGPSITKSAGIIGESVDFDLDRLEDTRKSTILYHLTKRLIYTKFRDLNEDPKLHLFGQLKRIAKQWMNECLECKGGTYPAQLIYQELADIACERITAGITRHFIGDKPVKALVDPYNPTGSTRFVNFNTSKKLRWETDARKCHVNWAILDSEWEGEFCRVVESHPNVVRYVKNHSLGFEVPYLKGSEKRIYRPDYIVCIDDGHGKDDLLHLVVEIKGYRGENEKDKKATMENYWVPGVNNLKQFGRWDFVEFRDVFEMESDFEKKLAEAFDSIVLDVSKGKTAEAAKV